MCGDLRQGVRPNAASKLNSASAIDELGQLLDVLLAAHKELSEGLMPRAARITGTGQNLARAISCVEAAIRTTENLRAVHECRAASGHAVGADGDMPSPDVVTCIDYLSEGREYAASRSTR